MEPLLQIRDLAVSFLAEDGTTRAVDGVSFDVGTGETLGLVGESGCGKSVTALSILGLLPPRAAHTSGSVIFAGQSLLDLSDDSLRQLRGNRIAMIFQEPMTSLNPALTIGHQIAEAARIHQGLAVTAARKKALAMLSRVRMPDAERRLDDYPHQLSGGQRQRVMIAMALMCQPSLLLADEPTTALDVTVQAQILELIRELKTETEAAVLLITHDLGVVAEMCDRVAVMYAGRIVEQASVLDLFERPAHPYTRGLLRAAQRGKRGAKLQRLHDIPGQVPSARQPIIGCAFAPRCGHAAAQCLSKSPEMQTVTGSLHHIAACLRLDEIPA